MPFEDLTIDNAEHPFLRELVRHLEVTEDARFAGLPSGVIRERLVAMVAQGKFPVVRTTTENSIREIKIPT